MSVDLEQMAADVAEIKVMLGRLLSGETTAPAESQILETLRCAEALGVDPVQAMDRFRVGGRRGRPAGKKSTRGARHV